VTEVMAQHSIMMRQPESPWYGHWSAHVLTVTAPGPGRIVKPFLWDHQLAKWACTSSPMVAIGNNCRG
jgi:hypothetical protein